MLMVLRLRQNNSVLMYQKRGENPFSEAGSPVPMLLRITDLLSSQLK